MQVVESGGESQSTGETSLAALAAQMDGQNQENPEAASAKIVETERLAAKYAEAARRNQALRARQREIKAPLLEKDSEIEKMKSEIARLKKYEDTQDPMELLKLKGLSYEDIIERNLNPEAHDSKEEIRKIREELEGYKKANEEKEKSLLEKQNEEVKSGYLNHIKKFTEASPEKYELINTLGHHKDVYEVIEETYSKTGKIISDEEAADLVEQYLEKEVLDKYSKINKLKNKIAPITDENQSSDYYSQSPTLSNQLTSQTTASQKTNLSEEEVLKRAASFIKWT